MITLDSASGLIDIPKVLNYDDLMNRIKEVLQINDQLFKYLYFSYIDEEEQERTRLIPQIYDDFVIQEMKTIRNGLEDEGNSGVEDRFNAKVIRGVFLSRKNPAVNLKLLVKQIVI